jgi:TetR/AcrR family transcriptional repressor of bet genes
MAATAEERPSRRALSKERRRQQLIDATIKCISNKGLGGLTLADVANEAGLSQGIVNLHFNSKDNLLNETLRFLAEDYDTQFMQTLEKSSPGAAETLLALMEMDLKPAVCDRKKLAVWFAFWGEVKTMPTYQEICAAYNDKYKEIIQDLCERIISEGNYVGLNAKTVTNASLQVSRYAGIRPEPAEIVIPSQNLAKARLIIARSLLRRGQDRMQISSSSRTRTRFSLFR